MQNVSLNGKESSVLQPYHTRGRQRCRSTVVCQVSLVSTKLCDKSLPKVLCVHACQVPGENLSRLLLLLPCIDRQADKQTDAPLARAKSSFATVPPAEGLHLI
jgi:hypothetical protein